MNSNESRTLWISLACGLFAAFLLYSYSQDKKAQYDSAFGAKKTVVVAKSDISELQTIDDTMIEIQAVPTDFKQPGVIETPELAVGQIAAVPIKKGEQLLQNKLYQPGPETGISLQVAPGKRAVTLPVDEIRGVAKLIRPGDRVDIYAAVDAGKGLQQRREVALIMQDVAVLATGVSVVNNIPRTVELGSDNKSLIQTNLTGDTKYNSLTIEAGPKEAQDLIYIVATSPGNIFFTLKNPNDRTPVGRLPSSSAESVLMRAVGEAPAAVPPGAPVLQPNFGNPRR